VLKWSPKYVDLQYILRNLVFGWNFLTIVQLILHNRQTQICALVLFATCYDTSLGAVICLWLIDRELIFKNCKITLFTVAQKRLTAAIWQWVQSTEDEILHIKIHHYRPSMLFLKFSSSPNMSTFWSLAQKHGHFSQLSRHLSGPILYSDGSPGAPLHHIQRNPSTSR